MDKKMTIIEYLEKKDINVWTSGKNISPGWIGISCMFCHDHSNHLGIRLEDLKSHCWKCGGKSTVAIIQRIERCNHKKAYKIFKSIKTIKVKTWTRPDVREKEQLAFKRNFMPIESSEKMTELHFEYLKQKRGLEPFLTARKYGLRFVGPVGKYKFRIIIPYYYKGVAYTFTARSVVKGQEKYLQPRKDSVPVIASKMLYNIDNLLEGHDCILSDGPVDTWVFGDGAVATTGLNLSDNQIRMFKTKKVRNLFIFADNDVVHVNGRITKRTSARVHARLVYRLLRPFVQHAEILTGTVTNDIGALTQDQALRMRLELKFDKGL